MRQNSYNFVIKWRGKIQICKFIFICQRQVKTCEILRISFVEQGVVTFILPDGIFNPWLANLTKST